MIALIAAVFLVSNESELRRAILDANARAGADTIRFERAGKIVLEAPLPVITDTLSIEGEHVELDGGAQTFPGLVLSADKCDVLGLTLTGFSAAVTLDGARECIVGPGTDIVGNDTGVVVTGASRGNQIFGNAIRANERGIVVTADAIDTDITNNRILFNSEEGVVVRGATVHGTSLDANDFAGNGVMLDLQDGANREQKPPVLRSALTDGAQIFVRGHLRSAPNTCYRVQFFVDGWYVGFDNVTTDAHGVASIDTNLVDKVTIGTISATATKEATHDSSELSHGLPIAKMK